MMSKSNKLISIFSFIILLFNVNNAYSKNRDANCRKNGYNFYYFLYGYDGKINCVEDHLGIIKFKSEKNTHKAPYQFRGEGKNENIYLSFYPNDLEKSNNLNKIVPLDIFIAVDLSSSVIPREKKTLNFICNAMENIYNNLYLKIDHLNFIGFAEKPFIISNLNGSKNSCLFAHTITNFFENENFRKNTNFKTLFKEISKDGHMTSEENGKILIILSDGIHDPDGDNIPNKIELLSRNFIENIASKHVLTFLFLYHEKDKRDKNKIDELKKDWDSILKKSGGKVFYVNDLNSIGKKILLISKNYIGRSLGNIIITGNKDNENTILNHNENRREDNLYFNIKMFANYDSELKYSVNDEGNYKYVFRKGRIPNFTLYKQEVPVKFKWDDVLNRDRIFVTFKNQYEDKFDSERYPLKFNKFNPIKIETIDELPISFCDLYEDAPTLEIRLNLENITNNYSELKINIQSDKLDFSIHGSGLKKKFQKKDDFYSTQCLFSIKKEETEKILTFKFPYNKEFAYTNLQFQVFAYKDDKKTCELLPLKINGKSEKNLKITIQKFKCISDKGKKIVNFFHKYFDLKKPITRTIPLFLMILLGLILLHENIKLQNANEECCKCIISDLKLLPPPAYCNSNNEYSSEYNNLTSFPLFVLCCLLLFLKLSFMLFIIVIPFIYFKKKIVLGIYTISIIVLFFILHAVYSSSEKDITKSIQPIKSFIKNKGFKNKIHIIKNFPLNNSILKVAIRYIYIPLNFVIIIFSIFLTCFPYNFAGLSVISILFSLMILVYMFMMNLQNNIVVTIFLNILCGLLISLLFS